MNKKVLRGYMVGMVILTVGAFLFIFFSVRQTYLQDQEHMLRSFAVEFAEEVTDWGRNSTNLDWNHVVTRGADLFQGQVTVYDSEWRYLADSHEKANGLYESWLDMEIANAKQGSFHRVVRWSEVFGTNTLYLITRIAGSDQTPIGLRVAYPLYALEDMRRKFLIACLGLVLFECCFFWMIEWLFLMRYERNMNDVNRILAEISRGQVPDLAPVENNRELHQILADSQRINAGLMEMVEKTNHRNSQINSVLLGINSGLLVMNHKMEVVLINPRGEELLCVDKRIFADSEMDSQSLQIIREYMQGVLLSDQPKTIVLNNDNQLELEIHMKVIRSKYAPYDQIGALAVVWDMTKMKKLERMRVEFVSNVSHELRTPLTIISGFVEMLKDWRSLEEEERDKAFHMIDVETERLKQMVSEILQLSQIEHRVNEAEYQSFDMRQTLESVADAMSVSCTQKQIKLQVVGPPFMVLIFSREEWVRQVLINLVENAIKYSPAHTSIEMGLAMESEQVRLWVKDEGAGISEEDQERIFERFYRVDKARSSKIKGSGLGLAIVKYMVKAMNGQIRVESQLGEGSRFTVFLPLEESVK